MNTNPMLRGLKPMHPGELLREVVPPALGRQKKEIAREGHVDHRRLRR